MKNILTLFISLTLIVITNQITGQTYNKIIGTFSGQNEIRDIYELNSNSFLVLGATDKFGAGSYDVLLMNVDSSANILWQKTFGRTMFDWGTKIVPSSDSSIVLVCNGGVGSGFTDQLIKINYSGDTLWTLSYPGTVTSGVSSGDGGFVFTGSYIQDKGIIFKVDQNGTLLWTKAVSEGSNCSTLFYDIVKTADNGYIAVGGTCASSMGQYDILAVKTDSVGNVVWKKLFGGAQWDMANSIIMNQSGQYIIAGSTSSSGQSSSSAILLCIDLLGNKIWDKTFGGSLIDEQYSFKSVSLTSDGGYLATGNLWGSVASTYVVRTDLNGDTLWTKRYNCDSQGEFIYQSTSGSIFIGSVITTPDNIYSLGNLIKADINGNITGSFLGGIPAATIVLSNQATSITAGVSGYSWSSISKPAMSQNTASYVFEDFNIHRSPLYKSDVSCNGANDGIAYFTSCSTYNTYAWSNSQTTEMITGLSPNTWYYVTVNNYLGNSFVDSVILSEPPVLQIITEPVNRSVFMGDSTFFYITATGGEPLNYQWQKNGIDITNALNDTLFIPNFTISDTGLYRCIVTNGCGADTSVEAVMKLCTMNANISGINATCNSSDGQVWVDVTGGDPPYLYSWNTIPVQTTDTIINLSDGIYNIIVTDLFGCTVTAGDTVQEIVYIPDANFKNYLINNFSINTNADSEIQCTEASTFTGSIIVSFLNISDLTGIEAFTFLTYLDCGYNFITNLDISANTALTYLDCGGNQLTNLDISTNTLLTDLNSSGNQLSGLILSANTSLTTLICDANQLISLDLSNNTSLTYLDCDFNQLTNLNIKNGNNINLSYFDATSNPSLTCIQVDDTTYMNTNWASGKDTIAHFSIDCAAECIVNIPDANFKAVLVANTSINTNLDGEIQCSEAAAFSGAIYVSLMGITDLTGIEAFTAITDLDCSYNSLISLNVSQNIALTNLICSYNSISSLDVSQNTNLGFFECSSNSLNSLDLSQNTALYYLYCNNNFLSSLNISQDTNLYYFDCSSNNLISLNLSQNSSLIELYCSGNQLTNLNIKNGNNINFTYFDATNNASLTCIQVDDTAFMNTNWAGAKDTSASYSEDCSQQTPLEISAAITDISCFGNFDASINLTVSGGTAPYSFAWSNFATTEDITNLSAGTYFVTITDSINTTVLDSFIIATPAPLTVNVNTINSNCSQTDGMAVAEPAGGTFPYSFSWSVAGNNDTLLNLLAGNYITTVTDFNGCLATNNFTIIENPALSVSILTYNDVTCFGMADGGATVFPLGGGGNAPYTYNWSDGQATQIATGFTAGTFQITITDSVGCFAVDSITISEPAQVSAPVVSDVNSCYMQSVPDLTAAGTNLNWFTDSLLVNLIFTGDSFATGQTNIGIYTYYVTQTVNGCTGSSSAIILSINPLPQVNLGVDTSLCPGYNLTLDAGNTGSIYTWNDNSTSQLLTVSAQGTYSVTVTDINGCINADNININLLSLASISGTVHYSGGLFPANTALAELYQANGTLNYELINTISVDAGMQFLFSNVASGNYVVRIKMIDTIPGDVSTYYDSTFNWMLADSIIINDCNSMNIDLNMYEMQQLSGPFDGFVSGTIVYTEYGGSKGTFAVEGGKATGNPVTGGEIYIELEPDDEPIANTQTDTAGFYFIDSLTINNTYSIYVDIPGFPLITTYTGFTPTALNPGFTNLNFIVDTTGANGGIYADSLSVLVSDLDAGNFSVQVYPNPFKDKIKLKYTLSQSAKVTIHLLDVSGKIIGSLSDSEQKDGEFEYTFDSKKYNLLSGSYILMIRVGNTVYLRKIVKHK